MSLSSNPSARGVILRGPQSHQVNLARLDSDLRTSPYAIHDVADPRLVDPSLAKAFDEALAVARAAAREEGFAQGRAEGLAVAQEECQQRLDVEIEALKAADRERQESMTRAIDVLEAAAASLAQRQVVALAGIEDLLLSAAYDLATTLLGRELAIAEAPVRDAVRRALTVLPGDMPVTVTVHPLDAAALADLDDVTGGRNVRIVTDSDVEPGSCRADGGATHVDASLSAALERVRQVLTP